MLRTSEHHGWVRILFLRPGGIGDCILSLPAMESVRSSSKEVWVPAAVVPLMRFADKADAISRTGIELVGIDDVAAPESLWERLRGFDRIVSWYGANRPEFRAALARYPVEFLAALPPDEWDGHAVDFFCRQVGSPAADCRPRIEAPRADGGFAVIHPFSGSPRKNWPLERFRELAALVSPRIPVRWCAGPEEELAEATRFDDLYGLACWLASARVYIGNDCGITHLAAAVGTPVVALFGPTDPGRWAPRGEWVTVLRMEAGAAEVAEAVECVGSARG